MRKLLLMFVVLIAFAGNVKAQIDLNKILNSKDLLGKVLKVKKGYVPKFSLGNVEIPKINKLGEILAIKNNNEINKLFKTFKTGRTVYKIASYTGSAVALYGTIKAIDKASVEKDYKGALIGGLSTIGAGVITKLLTKAASYKAVDIFNGVITKKIKDIISVKPASETLGVGLYVKL